MTIVTDPARPTVQAIFLKAHLKLMKVGMKNSRVSQRGMLDKAADLTGKKYPNSKSGLDVAIADLEELRAADR